MVSGLIPLRSRNQALNWLTPTNIYTTDELLDCMRGLVLQTQGCGISITQDSIRVFGRSSCEAPVSMEWQKLEILY